MTNKPSTHQNLGKSLAGLASVAPQKPVASSSQGNTTSPQDSQKK